MSFSKRVNTEENVALKLKYSGVGFAVLIVTINKIL
jgi:hypothetical protein